MIKAVIFDFSGVIGTRTFTKWAKNTDKDFDNTKEYYINLAEQIDAGEVSEGELTDLLSKKFGLPKDQIWPQIRNNFKLFPEMVELLSKLHKKYKTGLISNYMHEWLEQIIADYDLMQHFDEIIISSKVKLKKPDPRIYQMMLNRLKLRADETVFIDDTDYQVEGARAVGMHGIQFTGAKKLKEDLKTLGVDTN